MSDNRHVTFTEQGVTITIQPLLTGWDAMRAAAIYNRIVAALKKADGPIKEMLATNYPDMIADIMAATVKVKGLDAALPGAGDEGDMLIGGLTRMMELNRHLLVRWYNRITAISEAPNDAKLQPKEDVSPES